MLVAVSSVNLFLTVIFQFLLNTLSLFLKLNLTVVCRIASNLERWRLEVKHCYLFCQNASFYCLVLLYFLELSLLFLSF